MALPFEALQQHMQDMIKQQQEILKKQLQLQQQLQDLHLQQQQSQMSMSQDGLENKHDLNTSVTNAEDVKVDSTSLGLPPATNHLDDHHQCQHPQQLLPQQQQPLFSQHKTSSCSYYMRLRHICEHPEGMYTIYSPEWYIGNLGFRASLWPDNYKKSYYAALNLSYFSLDSTAPAAKTTVKCKVTLMDPLGKNQDCLLSEREAVFDGNQRMLDEWARGCLLVKIKMKDIKERGLLNDYTILIRYDVSISVQ